MSPVDKVEALSAEIDAALALLDNYAATATDQPVRESFPSLLAQCEAMCASFDGPEPVRSLHQFACTGGTLIAKCIAALPGVVLLNEIDPLSHLQVPVRPTASSSVSQLLFAPTDMFIALHRSLRKVDQGVISGGFRAAVEATAAALARKGQYLVIRDHAHSQFCTLIDAAERQTVHEILAAGRQPLSVVITRHPLDSFLSLSLKNWTHFSPPTLEEYSRRYMAFLDRHADLPVFEYEAFVADPARGLETLCRLLALPFQPVALDLFRIISVSGDSGRSGVQIAPRPRREVPQEIDTQRNGQVYTALCARLGYDT